MLIYLAHPVDQVVGGQNQFWHDWIYRLTQELPADGHVVFRPGGGWCCLPHSGPEPRLQQANMHTLGLCDAVVAVLPKGVPTIGTPAEIQRAVDLGKPVVVLTDIEDSQVLAGYGDQIQVYRFVAGVTAAANQIAKTVGQAQPAVRFTISQTPANPLSTSVVPVGAPSRAYQDDAGIDLTVVGSWTIPVGNFVDVHTQVTGVQLPPDTWAMVTGRSSTLRRMGLHVPVAVIDPGWRGPLYVGVWNLTDKAILVEHGQKLAQLICINNRTAELQIEVVDRLDNHPRGLNGFGSSGV